MGGITNMHKFWCPYTLFAMAAVSFVFVGESQAVVASASMAERQLEKFGTRIGRDEYVSVFKGPPLPGDGNGNQQRKASRTFVLLSKLFVLPSRDDTSTNEITFPGGPLKFRHAYIAPPATPSLPKVNTNSNQEKIFFPSDDDETTKKTTQYLYNKRPHNNDDSNTNSNPNVPNRFSERFPERKASYIFGPAGLVDSSSSPLSIANSIMMTDKREDDIGWYTLLDVPSRTKCPPGHRKDHRGLCRPIFTYRGTLPGPRPSGLSPSVALAQAQALIMEDIIASSSSSSSTAAPTTTTATTVTSTASSTEKAIL